MYQNPLQYPDLKIFLDIVYVPDGGDGGINHTSLLSVDRGIGRGRHTTRLGVTRRGKVFVHLSILWTADHTDVLATLISVHIVFKKSFKSKPNFNINICI